MAWQDDQAREEERALLQRRVAILLTVLAVMVTVSYAIGCVLVVVTNDGPLATHVITFFHVPVAVITGVLAWYLRRGSRSSSLLRTVEGAVTVALCVALATATIVAADPESVANRPQVLNLVAGGIMFLVLRATLVPSSPARTLVIGALSTSVLAGAVHWLYASFPEISRHWAASWAAYMWLAFGVGVSVAISRVFYGLRRQVAEARRLGQYVLDDKIGEGGMGEVYRAHHAMLRRETAVKLLPPERAGADSVARFEKEVQLAAKLTHPNTVSIFDYGRTRDGVFYYAMELLEGVDLERLVGQDGPQPVERVVHVLTQVCDSLHEAHEMGLVHRDIKPANIIVGNRGGVHDMVKVVDFGLVKSLGADGAEMDVTGANTIVGTPAYLAPEAITRGDAVDARSDLYAVGAVGFHMLTGEPPFSGESIVELCSKHLYEAPDRPSERLGAALPRDVEDVIMTCLGKDPDERPRCARALRDMLVACESVGRWTETEALDWWEGRSFDRAPAAGGDEPRRSVIVDPELRDAAET